MMLCRHPEGAAAIKADQAGGGALQFFSLAGTFGLQGANCQKQGQHEMTFLYFCCAVVPQD